MTSGMKTVIYPVRDLPAAKRLYSTLLGVDPSADAPYYVGFDVGSQHIGLDPNGHANGTPGPVGYWHVDDIDKQRQALLDAGAHANGDVREVGGGRRIATVTDADGNVIGLLQDT
jgi:predicted enzyme related to lactoylglutathione lyase